MLTKHVTLTADDAASVADLLILAADMVRTTAAEHAKYYRGRSAVSDAFDRSLAEVERLRSLLSAPTV